MPRRRTENDRDLDDWFAEPEPLSPRRQQRDRVPRADREEQTEERLRLRPDDSPSSAAALRRRRPGFAVAARFRTVRALALGVLAVAVLLIGLAVTGVFASKSGSPASKPSTTARTTSTPSTQPNSASVRIPTTTLKPRDHGSQVKALQRALAALGYSGGRVDGSYGPATERALARLQRGHNPTADGIFG